MIFDQNYTHYINSDVDENLDQSKRTIQPIKNYRLHFDSENFTHHIRTLFGLKMLCSTEKCFSCFSTTRCTCIQTDKKGSEP